MYIKKGVMIAAIATMLLATTVISTMSTTENAFAYSKNQAKSDINECGNGELPLNIGCQNADSQIQGDRNDVAIASSQEFGQDENGPPVPPDEVGCPDETVWDITIREQAAGEPLPVGTVICLFEGLGNHEALVLLTPPITADVNTNQPNVANCNGGQDMGQQVAEVTSGDPPNPLSMGSLLCATLMD
jgi:hypothetical protein